MQIIFGAGALGQAVMRELLRKGKQVLMVNRSSIPALPEEVEWVQGDARDVHFCNQVCKDADVIYNCIGIPYHKWAQEWPAIQRGIIEGAASSQAKLIYADNLYGYGAHEGPLHENLPYRPVGTKTSVRAKLSQMVLEAHRQGNIRAAIGRGSDFYGPGVRSAVLGERVFQAALLGKPVELIGDIDQPHTHIYIDDFACGLVSLSEKDEALGQIWHIPAAETVTTRQLVELIFHETGCSPKYRIARGPLLTVMGWFSPTMREFKELTYMFHRPFIVDHSKFENAFGIRMTPHQEAVRRTMDWYRKNQK
ncbi:NAD-dependent epimerase/dehydratase family protein [Marinicrinis lubricantis]|uniref:NAD-dependent epimerase/dehydratase family protein n=1 Tax=Marinicrinis lubricantis TaxID=2086470 RepID=A0ABW1ILR3_9BACL